MVGYLKKGFKYYAKTKPTLHNNGARINPHNSDEVARNLGVTINFCTFKVLIATISKGSKSKPIGRNSRIWVLFLTSYDCRLRVIFFLRRPQRFGLQSSSRFWRYLLVSKPWGRLRQIFVAFSEKLNFGLRLKLWRQYGTFFWVSNYIFHQFNFNICSC